MLKTVLYGICSKLKTALYRICSKLKIALCRVSCGQFFLFSLKNNFIHIQLSWPLIYHYDHLSNLFFLLYIVLCLVPFAVMLCQMYCYVYILSKSPLFVCLHRNYS